MSEGGGTVPEGELEAAVSGQVETLRLELEEAARRLKAGELPDDEAAALVERLADLAAELGRALDREASEGEADGPPGQEPLL